MPKKKRTLASALAEIDTRLDANELLTEQDRETIRAKAREHVHNKRKKLVEEQALAAAIEEEERRFALVEDYEMIEINLAPYAAMITLDGTMYFHGMEYEVPYSVARTLDDVMARTWEHQNEIQGQRRKGDMAWESTRKRRYERGGVKLQPGMENSQLDNINTRTLARV